MTKIRVFLADNHAILRSGVQRLIDEQNDMCVVGQAGNGQDAVTQAQACQPDVIIMDIAMPGMDGAEATEALQQVGLASRILVLTRHTDPGYLRRLLSVGATGYVLKRTAADKLIAAIRRVAAGELYIDPNFNESLTQPQGRRTLPGSTTDITGRHPHLKSNKLSEREMEVLRLIAWGYSNKEIAGKLQIAVKTVEAHKASAIEKLQLNSRVAIVRYALGQGWLQMGDEGE